MGLAAEQLDEFAVVQLQRALPQITDLVQLAQNRDEGGRDGGQPPWKTRRSSGGPR